MSSKHFTRLTHIIFRKLRRWAQRRHPRKRATGFANNTGALARKAGVLRRQTKALLSSNIEIRISLGSSK
ncbi:group II intron maturase-specific domain-containing protein [Spirosoma flavum]|uniref:Group II intron maturase-specific domain-containing protein n=1 Tax=Spirosoma flavum TaxID=2048557 RepID=A0ABW6AHY6_9BACT